MLTATPFTDVEFKQRLFNANLRRLQELQLQAAWQGLSCPPAVSMEIEALERELQEIHGISPPLQHSVAQSSSSQRTLVMVILLKKFSERFLQVILRKSLSYLLIYTSLLPPSSSRHYHGSSISFVVF